MVVLVAFTGLKPGAKRQSRLKAAQREASSQGAVQPQS